MKYIAEHIERAIKDYEPFKQEVEMLRTNQIQAQSEFDEAVEMARSKRNNEQQLYEQKEETRKTYKQCLKENDDGEESCKAQKKQFEIQLIEWQSAADIAEEKEDRARRAKRNLSNLTEELEWKTNKLKDRFSPIQKLKEELASLQSSSDLMYERYARLEGLSAQALYDFEWANLVEKFRVLNKSSDLAFLMLPIGDLRIRATTSGDTQGSPSIPAVLYSEIPGFSPSGADTRSFPNGKVKVNNEEQEKFALRAISNDFPLGSAISGLLVLSTIGACPLFPQGLSTERDLAETVSLAAHLQVNAYYDYPIVANRNYKVEYNLNNMVEQLEKMVEKGGFFSASNIHSFADERSSTDWIKISIKSNHNVHEYSPEEKKAIIKEVKLELIDRTLKHIAMEGENKKISLPSMPQETAANNIAKTCAWGFCFVHNYFLGILNGIFGRREAVAEFKKVNNYWTMEEVSDSRVMRQTGQIGFAP